ncbi:flagellar hook-associated protein 2 [mine drainage metagenome]|uniref:Filament cap protein n=1 Tax=mine drainage metagenome TaxID=410659 RepID=A0A1J5R2X2_9ZZZZ
MTSSSSPTITSTGIGSGIDINGLVSKLMTVESLPLTQLATKEATFQGQITALGSLKGALSSFQTAMSGMSTAAQFNAVNATPADATVLTATAFSTAAAGSYSVNVSALAQAQSLEAAGQTNSTSAIGTGASTTVSFQFGSLSGSTFTQDTSQAGGSVTIDSSNNSLQGIRDAINNANIGVTASIVNDGSANPYRLVLTSTKTGANSVMNITVSGDTTLQNLLAYNPAATPPSSSPNPPVQTTAAQNAAFTVNGVSITSASNTVATAIPGVTMNLLKQGASTTLAVARNTSAVQKAASDFVSAYNSLSSTLNSLSSYDATTSTAGPLLGDPTVLNIESQLSNTLNTPLAGLSGSLTNLTQIGITLQKDGTMALDSTVLNSAISSNLAGITGLFASMGQSTDSLVSYVSGSANTQPGSYAVNVTHLATQGSSAGQSAAGLTIDSSNNTLNLTIDGTLATVTLANATYASAADLAAQIQAATNANATFSNNGIGVTVTADGSGKITIASNSYGSASSVQVAGIGAANLGTQLATAGTDVAGTIGGFAAGGSGQFLTGATGSPSEGLQLQITGGATGSRGTVNFSYGYAYNLNNLMTSLLSSSGPIAAETTGINSSITDLDSQRTALNARLAIVQANYLAQFNAMDSLVATMKSTGDFLTQQLANLPSLSTK